MKLTRTELPGAKLYPNYCSTTIALIVQILRRINFRLSLIDYQTDSISDLVVNVRASDLEVSIQKYEISNFFYFLTGT